MESIIKKLKTKMSELPAILKDLEEIKEWRSGLIGPDGWLRRKLTSTLAETRIPNNDITLFDQSYVTAALFKSAAAGALLEGASTLPSQTQWCLLTVGMGSGLYEARSIRIGD